MAPAPAPPGPRTLWMGALAGTIVIGVCAVGSTVTGPSLLAVALSSTSSAVGAPAAPAASASRSAANGGHPLSVAPEATPKAILGEQRDNGVPLFPFGPSPLWGVPVACGIAAMALTGLRVLRTGRADERVALTATAHGGVFHQRLSAQSTEAPQTTETPKTLRSIPITVLSGFLPADVVVRRLFLKHGCPFSQKVVAYLGAADLSDKVITEFDTEENRALITEKVGKVTFPALEVEPGTIILESDDIIGIFAKESGVEPAALPLYQYYMTGLFPDFRTIAPYLKGKEGAEAVAALIAEGRKIVPSTTVQPAPALPPAPASMPVRRLFLKPGCPFSQKAASYLGAANLSSKVTVELDTDENRALITEKVGKVTFPALETEPGTIILESDDIIGVFAKDSGIEPASLPLYQYYLEGLFQDFRALSRHIKEKEGAEAFAELIANGRKKHAAQ